MSISTPIQTNFTAGEISPRLYGRVDLSRYFNGCRTLENFLVLPHGGIIRRSGFRFAAETKAGKRSLLVPFEFNTEQAYVLEFGERADGHGYMRVIKNGGLVLNEAGTAPYEIETPYGVVDLDGLAFAQSMDTLYIVHRGYAPRALTRTDHDAWTLAVMTFAPETSAPSSVTASATGSTGTTHKYRVATMGDAGESLCADEVSVSAAGTLNATNYVTLTISRVEGALSYHVYREVNGVWAWLARAGQPDAGDATYKDDGSDDPDSADNPLEAKNPFENEGDWPGAVCFFEDRLVLGGTDNKPSTIWFSRTSSYGDFREHEHEPLDDDAIELALNASRGNAVTGMVPRDKLYVLTQGGEWTVGGAGGEAITPNAYKMTPESSYGAYPAMPALVGNAALYIQRAGLKVREMAYAFESDSFASNNLTILSEHVTRPRVTQLAYAQEPDSVLYALRSDGQAVAMTYERAQEVVACSRLVTDGQFQSLAVVYDAPSRRDQLWACVRREVGGEWKYLIEHMEAQFESEESADAFFVDSGLTYDGSPASSVSGLEHLAGRTVAVLADGAVHPARVVAPDGSISLDRPAGVVHAGLPFTSTMETLRVEAGSQRGTAQTKRKRLIQADIRFHQTLGGRAGPDADNLEIIASRSGVDPMGSAPPLFSGDKGIRISGGWNRNGWLTVIQDQPLPMSMLAVVFKVACNE